MRDESQHFLLMLGFWMALMVGLSPSSSAMSNLICLMALSTMPFRALKYAMHLPLRDRLSSFFSPLGVALIALPVALLTNGILISMVVLGLLVFDLCVTGDLSWK